MAKLPDWIEIKEMKVKDNSVIFDVKIKYIPLRFLLGVIRRNIGWRIWQYPKVVKACLDKIGIVFHVKGFLLK